MYFPKSAAYFERGYDLEKRVRLFALTQIKEFNASQYCNSGVLQYELPELTNRQFVNQFWTNVKLLRYNRFYKYATVMFYPGFHNTCYQIVMLSPKKFSELYIWDMLRYLGKVEPFESMI